jgi:hypothetical protein
VLAVLASFSSLQGLLLWPLGLLVIFWRVEGRQERWRLAGCWLGAGMVTTALYFIGWRAQKTSSGQGVAASVLSHPLGLLRFLLVDAGNLLDNGGPSQLWSAEVLGAVVLLGAAIVVVGSLRARAPHFPLPLYLVAFGIGSDLLTAIGRTGDGLAGALSSRYTMPNLVMITAIGLFAWEHLELDLQTVRGALRGQHVARVAMGALLVALALGQIGLASRNGVRSAKLDQFVKRTGDRVVVNLDRIPAAERSALVFNFVYGKPAQIDYLVGIAQPAQLGVFAPGFYEPNRLLGPPPTASVPAGDR